MGEILDLVELIRGKLTKCKRGILGALITLDVHGRNVTEDLISLNTTSVEDFDWMAQLRYYWRKDKLAI